MSHNVTHQGEREFHTFPHTNTGAKQAICRRKTGVNGVKSEESEALKG